MGAPKLSPYLHIIIIALKIVIMVQKNSVVLYDWILIANNMVPDDLRLVNPEFDYLLEFGLDIDIRFG